MSLGTTSVPFVSANEIDESHNYKSSAPAANVQPMQTWHPPPSKSPPVATASTSEDPGAAAELLPSAVFSPEVQQKLFRSREVIARAAVAYQSLIAALSTDATGLPDLKDPRCWHNDETFALQDAQRELVDDPLLQRLREYVSFIDADRTPQIGSDRRPRAGSDDRGRALITPPSSRPGSPKRAADSDLPSFQGTNFRPFGDLGASSPLRGDFESGSRARGPFSMMG
jgi:hypothetical protein